MSRASRSLRQSRSPAPRASELLQAEHLIASGQGVLAQALLLALQQGEGDSPDIQRLLAIEALSRGDGAAARDAAWRAVQLARGDAFLQMLLGRAHKALGDTDAAIGAYRAAIELDPNLAQAYVSLGIALKAQGDLPAAIANYQRALQIDPELSAAHANLGVALARVIEKSATVEGDTSADRDMLDSLQRAVAIDGRDVHSRQNLAVALSRRRMWPQAAEQFNAALALDPRRQDSCIALHAVLERQQLHAAAREVCERWLQINPPGAATIEVINRLVSSLLALGELDAALPWAQAATTIAPGRPETRHNLANLLQQRLDVAGALAQLEQILTLTPQYEAAWSVRLMCLLYLEDDPLALTHAHREWGSGEHRLLLPAAAPGRPVCAARPGERPLRVGWVSGDLRRHSVAYFLEPLFECHDRSRFEWLAYHTGAQEDEVSARLKAHSDGWVSCHGLDDEDVAAHIGADDIDILIDLSGHTSDARLGVFARDAAPLQISYLGYPTTTGLAEIRWRLSDPVIDPIITPVPHEADPEQAGTEQVLRMPQGMFCYRPDAAPALTELPALRAGGAGEVTFGSFNNLAKVSPQTLALWTQVLRALPHSRLLLKARPLSEAGVRQRLLAALAALGVDAARVQLLPWAGDLASHLALYGQIDIGLDTVPYNGATTTCESLWMGVPVLTLRGGTHAARVGASIMTTVGLADWVAEDAADFVARAQAAAADPQALARLRAGLRQQLQGSPLLDAAGQTRDLEEQLATAWERHLRSP